MGKEGHLREGDVVTVIEINRLVINALHSQQALRCVGNNDVLDDGRLGRFARRVDAGERWA